MKNVIVIIFLLSSSIFYGQDLNTWLEVNSLNMVDENEFYKIDQYIEDVQIIGLGETSHGQGSFFEMKFKVFKYLVENKDYKIFALEAGFVECQRINAYVKNGIGDAVTSLKYLHYGVWEIKEFVELIEWMRFYNENRQEEDKVSFYGFDCQMSHGAIDELIKLDKEINLGFISSERDLLEQLRLLEFSRNKRKAKTLLNPLRNMNTRLIALIEKSELESKYKLLAKTNLEILEQFCESEITGSAKTRAKFMAKNVQNILNIEGVNNKIVLSAHNGHIFKLPSSNEFGFYLNEIFDARYYAVCFEFNRGKILGFDIINGGIIELVHELEPSKKGSLGDVLLACQKSIAFIDLRYPIQTNTIPNWFLTKQRSGDILGCYGQKRCNKRYWKINISESYDAIIYLRTTKQANFISVN